MSSGGSFIATCDECRRAKVACRRDVVVQSLSCVRCRQQGLECVVTQRDADRQAHRSCEACRLAHRTCVPSTPTLSTMQTSPCRRCVELKLVCTAQKGGNSDSDAGAGSTNEKRRYAVAGRLIDTNSIGRSGRSNDVDDIFASMGDSDSAGDYDDDTVQFGPPITAAELEREFPLTVVSLPGRR